MTNMNLGTIERNAIKPYSSKWVKQKAKVILKAFAVLATLSIVVTLFIMCNQLKEANQNLSEQYSATYKNMTAWMDEAYRLNGEVQRYSEENSELLMENEILADENLSLYEDLQAAQDKIDELTMLLEAREQEEAEATKLVHEYSNITLSEYEWELFPLIVALEAGDQSNEGQRAVIEVACNRVNQSGWGGNTIKDILLAKGQFETVKWLDNPYNLPGEKEINNIKYVLENGRTVLPSSDYVYFASYSGANGYDEIKIGDHYFAKGGNR